MDDRLMQATLELDEQHWWYRGRREIIRVELGRLALPDAPEILDAGCGSGRTLVELQRLGRVTGVELDPGAVEVARERGFEVLEVRLEALPWADDRFDLITCLDVIEHTPDDVVTLAELRRVTRADGYLLVTVPAYPALWSVHDVANHHYRRYNRASLRGAAIAAGWRLERMTSFNSLLLAPAAIVRLAQRKQQVDENFVSTVKLGPPWLNRLLERPMHAEARWLRRGRRLPAGLSLLAVLRNPG